MKTVLNVKVDREVKQKAQRVAAELGLPLSIVVNAHLRQFARERRITFSVSEKMPKRLEHMVAEAERDLKRGKNISPVFASGAEMDRYLNAL